MSCVVAVYLIQVSFTWYWSFSSAWAFHIFWHYIVIFPLFLCFIVAGQEENLYAKKNYEKYLSALKNSGLVSVEEKAQGATADVTVGAEGGAGAMVLLGRTTMTLCTANYFLEQIFQPLYKIQNVSRRNQINSNEVYTFALYYITPQSSRWWLSIRRLR